MTNSRSIQAKSQRRDRVGQFADENKQRIPHSPALAREQAMKDRMRDIEYCNRFAGLMSSTGEHPSNPEDMEVDQTHGTLIVQRRGMMHPVTRDLPRSMPVRAYVKVQPHTDLGNIVGIQYPDNKTGDWKVFEDGDEDKAVAYAQKSLDHAFENHMPKSLSKRGMWDGCDFQTLAHTTEDRTEGEPNSIKRDAYNDRRREQHFLIGYGMEEDAGNLPGSNDGDISADTARFCRDTTGAIAEAMPGLRNAGKAKYKMFRDEYSDMDTIDVQLMKDGETTMDTLTIQRHGPNSKRQALTTHIMCDNPKGGPTLQTDVPYDDPKSLAKALREMSETTGVGYEKGM